MGRQSQFWPTSPFSIHSLVVFSSFSLCVFYFLLLDANKMGLFVCFVWFHRISLHEIIYWCNWHKRVWRPRFSAVCWVLYRGNNSRTGAGAVRSTNNIRFFGLSDVEKQTRLVRYSWRTTGPGGLFCARCSAARCTAFVIAGFRRSSSSSHYRIARPYNYRKST